MSVDFITIDKNGKTVVCTPARWLTSRTPNRASEHALSNPPSGPVPYLASIKTTEDGKTDDRTCTVVAPRHFIALELASVKLGCAKEALLVVLAPPVPPVEDTTPYEAVVTVTRKARKK